MSSGEGKQEMVSFSMEPKTLDEAMKYAEIIAKSSLVPKDFINQPGNVLVAIQMGQEIGLKPLQALQNIAVINGRPCLWGDAVLALVRGSGLLEDFREDFDEPTQTAICSAKRKGQPTVILRRFGMEDAKKAGLFGKQGTWQTYPRRMMQMRARAFALRDGFADVLKGLAIAEEQEDVIEADGQEAPTALPPPPAAPRRLSQSSQPPPSAAPEVPVWKEFVAKADGVCAECQGAIASGAKAYYSSTGTARCVACQEVADEHEKATL